MSIILSAVYNKSASNNEQCPLSDKPEFAFIGRSNVGKSTLINILCKRKELAKTSAKPGKTQLINYFDIVSEGEDKESKSWHLVDLPGYGYAKITKSKRKDREGMIGEYLTKKENLTHIFVLIDSRLVPQIIDLEFTHRLSSQKRPFSLIFTKSDKATQKEISAHIKAFFVEMSKFTSIVPYHLVTSSEKRHTTQPLLDLIHEMIV